MAGTHSIIHFRTQDKATVSHSGNVSSVGECSLRILSEDFRCHVGIFSDDPTLFDFIAEHATQCASLLRERAAVTVPCNPPVETEVDNGIG